MVLIYITCIILYFIGCIGVYEYLVESFNVEFKLGKNSTYVYSFLVCTSFFFFIGLFLFAIIILLSLLIIFPLSFFIPQMKKWY